MIKRPEEQSNAEWLADYDSSKPANPNLSVVSEDPSGEGEVDEHPLIPEGKYRTRYVGHSLIESFRGYGDKLVLEMCVVDTTYEGETVKAYYNIQITGRGWKAKGGSRWVLEMRKLFPQRKRKDRLPPSLLKEHDILAKIRTVQVGSNNRTLLPTERYSVVKELIALLD